MNSRQRRDRDHDRGRHDKQADPDCFGCAARTRCRGCVKDLSDPHQQHNEWCQIEAEREASR